MSRGRVQSRKGRRMANRSRGGDVVNFLFLCAVGVFMALPLVYVIVNAFKPLDEIFMFPPRFFVRNPTMNNFSELYIVLADSWVPFSRYVFNTLFITATARCSMCCLPLWRHLPCAKSICPAKTCSFSSW